MRFHRRRAEVTAEIARLLGPRGARTPVAEPERAAALERELGASYGAAGEHPWGIVAQEWPVGSVVAVTDTLHRLSRNLRQRPVWLVLAEGEPQCVPLDSESVLDNPLGFAGLAGQELRLLDRLVPAGLLLVRRAEGGDDRWLLEVWGEPWLSATTTAIRGDG